MANGHLLDVSLLEDSNDGDVTQLVRLFDNFYYIYCLTTGPTNRHTDNTGQCQLKQLDKDNTKHLQYVVPTNLVSLLGGAQHCHQLKQLTGWLLSKASSQYQLVD